MSKMTRRSFVGAAAASGVTAISASIALADEAKDPSILTNMNVQQPDTNYWADKSQPCDMGNFKTYVGTFCMRSEILDEVAKGVGAYFTIGKLEDCCHEAVENFVASAERYNELCKAGKDDGFGKKADFMLPAATPPFYGSVADSSTQAGTAVSLGGLKKPYVCVLI